MEITGFHGTSSVFKANIEKNGLDPNYTQHRNDHWLGQGVYFYDNEDQAKWWANNSVKKNNGYRVVYEASLVADDDLVLDLDNPFELSEFVSFAEQLADDIRKEKSNEGIVITDKQYRSIAFDYYKTINNFLVILATFSKESTSYIPRSQGRELEFQKAFLRNIGLGYKERQICVSSADVIYSLHIVYDEENEVI